VQHVDLTPGLLTQSTFDSWRGGPAAAEDGWNAAGVRPKPKPVAPRLPEGRGSSKVFAVGMVVRHPTYGGGRIIDVSGNGALRRVKIRFATAGERSFIAEKVTLEIVSKG
jgi:DNA helicase-2/ATP-dependent DNA helicase PcrA